MDFCLQRTAGLPFFTAFCLGRHPSRKKHWLVQIIRQHLAAMIIQNLVLRTDQGLMEVLVPKRQSLSQQLKPITIRLPLVQIIQLVQLTMMMLAVQRKRKKRLQKSLPGADY